ncbi:uncharacterized protein RJT20DRAFT_129959 [Scheffersomyces xylosifermentans]|uniref:uncharacterized protein n=1 Tax=Scheffersomyces xylosifermentans TaxID=1304137 RepID=UPI00315D06F4
MNSSMSTESELTNKEMSERNGSLSLNGSNTDRQTELESIEPFEGHNQDSDIELHDGAPISRQQSILERVQTSYSFFNEKLSIKRHKLLYKFGLIYFLMAFFVLGIFSIYWGSMYNRFDRISNLRMLVVIADDKTVEGIDPLFGQGISTLFNNPVAKFNGDWIIFNSSEFQTLADRHNNTIEQEIERQIHHQKYWSSIYVKENATYNYYQALLKGDTSYNITNNTAISIYETGRDFINMNSYVTPGIQVIEELWLDAQSDISLQVADLLPNKSEALNNRNSLTVLTTAIGFGFFDRRPFTNPVLVAPSQVGLIYMIIVTFFQFNFFADVHQEVAKFGLKKHHFMTYRILASILSFFVLSLFYSFVSLAMQVDFTVAFGKSGFLVYWMISFLTMWAVGSANEIMALLIITVYPPLLGFWMLFWVIINISPTFTPMALSPKFFRYGYALPIHASYECTKVIFFDTYKGAFGRNVAILVIWIVILTALLPFVVIYFAKAMGKKAQAAAAAAAAAAAEKKAEEEKNQSV